MIDNYMQNLECDWLQLKSVRKKAAIKVKAITCGRMWVYIVPLVYYEEAIHQR